MNGTGSLGEVIRERRRSLGLTQEQLAERIGAGVRQAEVSRLERGRVGLPRRQRLERIAAALELSVGELLVRSGWSGADAAMPSPDAGEKSPLAEAPIDRSDGDDLRELRQALARSMELRERTDQLLQQATRIAQSWEAPRRTAERPVAIER